MLLKYASCFVCPVCKGNLTLTCKSVYHERVEDGEFHCAPCDRTYPIENNVPIFLLTVDKVKQHTAKSFGYKWNKFKIIDEYYKKNFLDELPPLDYTEFFKDKTVLDAGTGIGIPAYCMAENGAREVFGVDISDSIYIAYKNTEGSNNITVAQGDIYHMPFSPETFDVVVCVGVLQHLPDPWGAVDELLCYVKSGGTLVLWVYGREGNLFVRFFVEPFRKLVSRKLPLSVVLIISYILGAIFQFVAQLIYSPLNRLNITWLPLNSYILYRTNFNYKMNTQMIFDQLLAPLSYLFSREEVETLCKKPGIAHFVLRHHNNNSWTAICHKK